MEKQTRRNPSAGFSLMELLIVIAVIVTILGIAIPHVQKVLQEANEMAVMKQLGTIHTSQAQYHSQYDKYAVTLAELGPPPAGAGVLSEDLTAGKKNGYSFHVQGTESGYVIHAEPLPGKGRRTFYSDQSMTIRNNWGKEQATVASPPVK